jgi:hypothetical protein
MYVRTPVVPRVRNESIRAGKRQPTDFSFEVVTTVGDRSSVIYAINIY